MKTPYFYAQTSICFLDDNNFFLEGVKEAFSKDFSIILFDNIDNFLVYTKDDLIEHYILRPSVKEEENTSEQQSVISLNLQSLVQGVEDLSRLDKKPLGVSFVDYSMPSEDGLSVMCRMNDDLSKKVLLTGELGVEEAIEALNAQKIDAYLNKNSISIEHDLRETIRSMMTLHLTDLNKRLDHFFPTNAVLKRLYESEEFSKLFWEAVENNQITHSSLFEPYGSQFLISDRERFLLNVYHHEEIDLLILPLIESCHEKNIQELFLKSSLLDYKTPTTLQIPMIESWGDFLIKDFKKICLGPDEYFVTFRKQESKP